MAACVSWSARAAARAELRTQTIKSIPTHNCYPIQPSPHNKHNTTKTLQPTLLFSSWTTLSVTRPPVLCDCSPPEQPSPLETFLLICISFPGFSTNVSQRGLQVGVRCLTRLLQITPHSELWAEKNIWKVRRTLKTLEQKAVRVAYVEFGKIDAFIFKWLASWVRWSETWLWELDFTQQRFERKVNIIYSR